VKKYFGLVAGMIVFAFGLSAMPVLTQTAAQSTDTSTAKSAKKHKKKASTDTAAATPAPAPTPAASTPAAPAAKTKAPTPANNASASDIASAQASGKVWVNTETGVYHKSGQWYGKTKKGKFMSEDEAKKAGYHAAKGEIGAKKS
jgi:zona occludens toxin (predicted ATPase)